MESTKPKKTIGSVGNRFVGQNGCTVELSSKNMVSKTDQIKTHLFIVVILASVEAHKNCTVGRISGRQCGVLGIVFN